MSEILANKITPVTGTTVTLGDSGDTFTIPSGVTVTNSGTATGFGKVVQVVSTQTGAVATGTGTYSANDNIPTTSNGNEYLTLAITPTNASNKLKIETVVVASSSGANETFYNVLHQDSTSNALASTAMWNETATTIISVPLIHYMTAGTTSSTTFKLRAGCGSAQTMTLNGHTTGRIFGGVFATSITITEISV